MRNKIAKEMRRVIRSKYGSKDPALQKKLYKGMKRVWKKTPKNEKHSVTV